MIKTSADIRREIAGLEHDLDSAEKMESGLTCGRIDSITSFLHQHMCKLNHTDGCDWGYPGSGSEERYQKKAKKLVAVLGSIPGGVKNLQAIVEAIMRD